MPIRRASSSSSRTASAYSAEASTGRGSSGAGPAGAEPRVGREPDERLVVVDRLGVGEVGAHQALLHRVLDPARLAELDQPLRVERVPAACAVEVVLESLLGRETGEALVRSRNVLRAHPVLGG